MGLVLLLGGGEILVIGAIGLVRRLGWAPAAVGALLVGAGTSAPELAASLGASLRGEHALVLGAIVGSNVANIVLILGLCALAAPLGFRRRPIALYGVAVVGSAALLAVLAWDGAIGRAEGGVLLVALAVVLTAAARSGIANGASGGDAPADDTSAPHSPAPPTGEAPATPAGPPAAEAPPVAVAAAAALGGLVLLPLGANLLVEGAIGLARLLAVEERLIGLSVVAIGTSLPELASVIAASRRGRGEMVVGSLLGSNVFNIVAILGLTAVVAPLRDLEAARLDLVVLLAVSAGVVSLIALRSNLDRRLGLALVAGYAALAVAAF